MARPGRVSVFTEPPPQIVTVSEEPKEERPSRVSVFTEPPEPIIYSAPKQEKPSRVSVFDPSTESSQVRFDPFFGQLEGVFGQPTVRAEPIVTDICPTFCKITYIPGNIVSYEGNCSCATMERYDRDPDYRVEVITKQIKPEQEVIPEEPTTVEVEPPTLEPEPEEEPATVEVKPPGVVETSCYLVHGQTHQLTQQAVDYYRNIGVTVTPCEAVEEPETVDVPPPEFPPEPEPTVTVPTGLPTTANFGIAGILFAGVLALPILAGLGKWK